MWFMLFCFVILNCSSYISCDFTRSSLAMIVSWMMLEISCLGWSMFHERKGLVMIIIKRLVPWMHWYVFSLSKSNHMKLLHQSLPPSNNLPFYFSCELQQFCPTHLLSWMWIVTTIWTIAKHYGRQCVFWWTQYWERRFVTFNFLRDLMALINTIDIQTTMLCFLMYVWHELILTLSERHRR